MTTTEFIKVLEGIAKKMEHNGMLLNYIVNPPADAHRIDEIKNRFFNSREHPLFEFYRHCNGVQLIWNDVTPEGNINYEPLLFYKKNIVFKGVINILPIEICFATDQWKDTIWFDNDSDRIVNFNNQEISNRTIKRSLFPVDYFSVDMSMAILVTENVQPLLLLQDYHIAYDDSYLINFPDYLQFLVATEGLAGKRYQVFNQLNGYKQPMLNQDVLDSLLSKNK